MPIVVDVRLATNNEPLSTLFDGQLAGITGPCLAMGRGRPVQGRSGQYREINAINILCSIKTAFAVLILQICWAMAKPIRFGTSATVGCSRRPKSTPPALPRNRIATAPRSADAPTGPFRWLVWQVTQSCRSARTRPFEVQVLLGERQSLINSRQRSYRKTSATVLIFAAARRHQRGSNHNLRSSATEGFLAEYLETVDFGNPASRQGGCRT